MADRGRSELFSYIERSNVEVVYFNLWSDVIQQVLEEQFYEHSFTVKNEINKYKNMISSVWLCHVVTHRYSVLPTFIVYKMYRKMEKLEYSKLFNCFDQNHFHSFDAICCLLFNVPGWKISMRQETKERNPEKRPNTREREEGNGPLLSPFYILSLVPFLTSFSYSYQFTGNLHERPHPEGIPRL